MATEVITNDQVKANVSANIRRLLSERGWSVNHFARQLGEPRNTVYRIVRGENVPGAVLLARIAGLLDSTVDVLIQNSSENGA